MKRWLTEGVDRMKSEYMKRYFQLIDQQRHVFYYDVLEAELDPWARPLPNKWSVWETVYHLYLLARLVRRFSAVYLPLMLPYGALRKNRPYQTEIHHIYEDYTRVKNRPMPAPSVLVPPKNVGEQHTFKDIQRLLNFETVKLRII